MTIEFRLPEVAEGVETADVADIKVAEGDVIRPEQVVMELETEKAVVELPCPYGGRVVKVHVKPGDSVPIGALLLTIDETASEEAGEAPRGDADSGEAAASKSPQIEASPQPASRPSAPAADSKAGGDSAAPVVPASPATIVPSPVSDEGASGFRPP
ncbi:MAG: hypothetical protein D6725_10365, partial [Planctomycetota bacterium]